MGRAAAAMLVLAAGCTYDWTIVPLDAAPAEDGTALPDAAPPAPDALVLADASADAGAVLDDAQPADTGGPPPDGGVVARDAGPSDAADCAALEMRADMTKAAARACMLGDAQCLMSIQDVCMCKVFVADGTSAAAQSFAAATMDLLRSGCPIQCSTCPVGPVQGVCLQQMTGGPACWP